MRPVSRCLMLAVALCVTAPAHARAADTAAALVLASPDLNAVQAEDTATPARFRYALPLAVRVRVDGSRATHGRWTAVDAGQARWTLDVRAPGAVSLDFGFAGLALPPQAELRVRRDDDAGTSQRYTATEVAPNGTLWTAIITGDAARIELTVPAAARSSVALALATVHYGYRDLHTGEGPLAKSASCHVDTGCPLADPYREQVRSVARYTVGGSACTGQLLANTAADNRRFFLTAAHCVDTPAEADGVVVYWRYENPGCRAPGSAESATPLPLSSAIAQTGGADLRASDNGTDFTLLELRSAIPAGVEPFFAGWDRRTIAPTSAFTIHHPAGHEKRISVENNPLGASGQIGDKPGSGGGANSTTLRVADWDQGSVEPGSDGAALFSPDGRVIGQLSAGTAACGNNSESLFGRLSQSWRGGGTAATRLSDWLDPIASDADVFDGQSGGCSAPQLTFTVGDDDPEAGRPLPLNLAIAGGAGPYTVEFDVDGDGLVDRTLTGVSANASVSPVFPTFTETVAFARATDAAGCSASESVVLFVGSVDIQPTPAPAQQLCGDGDAAIEPGERWQVPIELSNQGGQALIGGHAVNIPISAGDAAVIAGPDTFGNTLTDDTTGCGHRFIDITGTAPLLPIIAGNPDTSAEDDGHAAPVAVTPFDFYGERVTQLVMSTNGYLSTSAEDSGANYSNECGVVPLQQGGLGARINAFWDDLVVGPAPFAGMRHQLFDRCPRPAETTTGATSCHVFQWSGFRVLNAESTDSFDFEVVIYPATNQIVLQYRRSPPGEGNDATVGFQNTAADDGIEYACFSEGSIVDERAVCMFHPQFSVSSRPSIRIETPAIALPDLAPGASTVQNLRFAVAPDAACGTPFEIKYMGAVDQRTYSLRFDTMIEAQLGGDEGSCQVAECGPPQVPAIVPLDGLYSSLLRFGNGIGSFNIPIGGGRRVFGGQWFTGTAERSPTWLILQGAVADGQARVPIFRFGLDTVTFNDTGVFQVASDIVGSAVVTYTSPTQYVLFWNLEGVSGAERLDRLYGTALPTPNRTGSWFHPAQSGWGQAVDDHFLPNGAREQVIVNYLYDANGAPVWTLGGAPNLSAGTMNHNMFFVHCPSCPALADFFAFRGPAGTVNYEYPTLTNGVYSTALQYPLPIEGEWIRNAVPIQMISAPVPQ